MNFSKSGIGFSVGVKGARMTFSKRGTYVTLGAKGIYYRQRINTTNKGTNSNFTPAFPAAQSEFNIPHTITTVNLEDVTDVDSKEFINELESKENKISLLPVLGILPSLLVLIYCLVYLDAIVKVEESYKESFTILKGSVNIRKGPSVESPVIAKGKRYEKFNVIKKDSTDWIMIEFGQQTNDAGFVRADMGQVDQELIDRVVTKRVELYPWLRIGLGLVTVLLVCWCVFLSKKDKKRKSLEIYYTMDESIQDLHNKFLEYFREFSSARKIWQKLHVQSAGDRRYNAGATELVARAPVNGVSFHKLPSPFLKTNLSIPYIGLRNTELYFFPERVILKRGKKFAGVFYKNIQITRSDVRFIEEEGIPADADIVDYTWKYVNKSGGPDRRFGDNRQLPICLYSDYLFESDNGVHEVITTSKPGIMDKFAGFIKTIGDFQRNLN